MEPFPGTVRSGRRCQNQGLRLASQAGSIFGKFLKSGWEMGEEMGLWTAHRLKALEANQAASWRFSVESRAEGVFPKTKLDMKKDRLYALSMRNMSQCVSSSTWCGIVLWALYPPLHGHVVLTSASIDLRLTGRREGGTAL